MWNTVKMSIRGWLELCYLWNRLCWL